MLRRARGGFTLIELLVVIAIIAVLIALTNGGVYYSGFTTAVPPNPKVNNGAGGRPFDWVSIDENNGGPTYASLSASSYHPGGVNALLGDGSVKFIKDSISPATWRALGTIGQGEVISADSF